MDELVSRRDITRAAAAAGLGALVATALPSEVIAAEEKQPTFLWAVVNRNGELIRSRGVQRVEFEEGGNRGFETRVLFDRDVDKGVAVVTSMNYNGLIASAEVANDMAGTGKNIVRVTTRNVDRDVFACGFYLLVVL